VITLKPIQPTSARAAIFAGRTDVTDIEPVPNNLPAGGHAPSARAASRAPRAAIYARSASVDPNAATAIENQIQSCQALAESAAWNVVAVFHDAPRSGVTLAAREGLASLIAAAERGDFDVVLAERVDRLGRNASDAHHLLANLRRLGIALLTVDSGLVSDLTVAMYGATAAQAQMHKRRRKAPSAI
jgi:DNA invertase Pin-like site-specific DNA recombinase